MTKYEIDLEYAKKVLKLFQDTVSGELDQVQKLMVSKEDDMTHLSLTDTELTDIIAISHQNHERIGRGSDSSVLTKSTLLLEYGDSSIYIYEDGGMSECTEIQYPSVYSEELHFQYSTIYNEFQTRMMFVSWYLNLEQNRLQDVYMIEISFEKFYEVLLLLDKLDNEKDRIYVHL